MAAPTYTWPVGAHDLAPSWRLDGRNPTRCQGSTRVRRLLAGAYLLVRRPPERTPALLRLTGSY